MARAKPQRARSDVLVDVMGDKELARTLTKLGQVVARDLLAEALEAGAEPVVAKAKQLVPKPTGQLMRSIQFEPVDQNDRISEGDVGPAQGNSVPDDGFYGFWVEFGNYDKPGTPFMSRAADMTTTEAQQRMADVIAAALTKAAR